MTSKTSKSSKKSEAVGSANPFGRGGVSSRRTAHVANNDSRPVAKAAEAAQTATAATTAAVVGGAAIEQVNQSQAAQETAATAQPAIYAQPVQPTVQPVYNQPYQPNAYVQQPAGQPAPKEKGQYEGINGALAFFTFCFGLSAIGWIYTFFQGLIALAGGDTDINTVVFTISGVLIGAMSLVTLITICLRKKLAKAMAISTLVLAAISYLTQDIISIASMLGHGGDSSDYLDFFSAYQPTDAQIIIAGVGIVIMQLIILTLVAVYFLKSRRVRDTLTE